MASLFFHDVGNNGDVVQRIDRIQHIAEGETVFAEEVGVFGGGIGVDVDTGFALSFKGGDTGAGRVDSGLHGLDNASRMPLRTVASAG